MIPELEQINVERIHGKNDSEKKSERKAVNVDMNPMVDLAFLLLTFFMLATTFSKPQAMELLMPAKPKEADVEKEMPVKESKTLSIVLKKDGITWYHGITDPETHDIGYENGELQALLERYNTSIAGLVVLIKPLESSSYGHVVKVLDALNFAGVKRYALSELSDFDLSLEEEPAETDNDI